MEKAREKDRENQERAVEAEEYARQGKLSNRRSIDLSASSPAFLLAHLVPY